jgi:hypothetical protein
MSEPEIEVRFPEPEAGLTPFQWGDFSRSFVSGHPASKSLRARFYFRPSDQHVIGHAWFGPHAEGPPKHAHGGSIAAVLDEAMGATPWASRISVLGASLTVHFKEMIPLGTLATIECWIEKVEGRKVWTKGTVSDGSGKIFSLGEGLFLKVPLEHLDLSDMLKAHLQGIE